ncbi:hypothetical protein AcW1_010140 [Taiwanofungus camphoratus]|nr:hypothetical protein AcV5_003035 [Antrodia cinnamomea]KAI0946771.1 hypothetical protein AcW1_010140 [Antrodia cinnamomea]KAI0954283.1 hypothetical protein AcV7_007558 [Antrodia cinnamomea]
MLVGEDKLDELLKDCSKTSFAEAGEDLKKKFIAFTDALTSCNNDIVSYNVLLQVINNRLDSVDKLNDMKKVAEKKQIVGPDLQAMTNYM